MHMTRKGQMAMAGCEGLSFAKQFFALAGQVRPAKGQWHVRRSKFVFSKLTRQSHWKDRYIYTCVWRCI
jgi:hypothetical protein